MFGSRGGDPWGRRRGDGSGGGLESGVGAGLEFVAAVVGFLEGVAVFWRHVVEVAGGIWAVAEALVAAAFLVSEGESVAFGLRILRGDNVVGGVIAFVVSVLIPGAAGVIGVRRALRPGVKGRAVDGGGASVVDPDEVGRVVSFVNGVTGVGEAIGPDHAGLVATGGGEADSGEGERGEDAGRAERFHGCIEE